MRKDVILHSAINNLLEQVNEEYSAIQSDTFEADIEDDTIYFALENIQDAFYEDFTSRYPMASAFEPFTLSVLHEIGHLETEDDTIDDIEERNAITTATEYFALYNETIATDWAGFFIEDNYTTVMQFDSIVKETFLEGRRTK